MTTHAHRPDKIQRFDVHQRIQHFLALTAFMLCGFTGWALRAAEHEPSMAIAEFFGGAAGCRIWHRVGGVLLIAALLYHLGYIAAHALRGRFAWEMLPGPKDAVDVYHNLLYLLGRRARRADFGRWSYIEKFDYFAGGWGKFVMSATGLILWFPVTASAYVPGEWLLIAQLVHGREALIAILVIFIWHMYNEHLRPGVFPMSRVWLDGTISVEELEHHHPAEYRKLFPEAGAKRD